MANLAKTLVETLVSIVKTIFTDLFQVLKNPERVLFKFSNASVIIPFLFIGAGVLAKLASRKSTPTPQQVGGALTRMGAASLGSRSFANYPMGPQFQRMSYDVASEVKSPTNNFLKYIIVFIGLYVAFTIDYFEKSDGTNMTDLLKDGFYNTFAVFVIFLIFKQFIDQSVTNETLRQILYGIFTFFIYNYVTNFRDVTKRNVYVKVETEGFDSHFSVEPANVKKIGENDKGALKANLKHLEKKYKSKKSPALKKKIDAIKAKLKKF